MSAGTGKIKVVSAARAGVPRASNIGDPNYDAAAALGVKSAVKRPLRSLFTFTRRLFCMAYAWCPLGKRANVCCLAGMVLLFSRQLSMCFLPFKPIVSTRARIILLM